MSGSTALLNVYLHVLQGAECLETEVIQQLAEGWLGAPCQELLAYMQEACFLVISTSTPTEYLLQQCEMQGTTFGELLGNMQQVEFSFVGVNQMQPGRQFALIRHKHEDSSVVDYCLEHYMPCLPGNGIQHTFQTPPQAWAAHLQQLKAPPLDIDITGRHSKLGSSAVADAIAKVQPGSAPLSSAELEQECQQQQRQQQQQSESARIAEVRAAPTTLRHFSALPLTAATTTAQIDTLPGPSVPAALPKVGKVKLHSSAVDPNPAVSTAEVKAAEAKPAKAKTVEARVAKAKPAGVKPAEVKAKVPQQERARSSSPGASTKPTSEQGMPNISSK